MKKTLSLLLTVMLLMSNAYANEKLDNIVAVVNDDVVTQSELKHALQLMRIQMQQADIPEDQLRKQVLTQLINKKIQLQLAKQANIETTEQELDKAIDNIAEQNNMTSSELYARIKQDGLSKKGYRDELREQLIMHKLQQQEVIGRLSINPHEIKNYRKTQSWQDTREKEFQVEDILIPVADNASEAEINTLKQHARQVYVQLQRGKALNEVAKAYRDTNKALQHEDLGWRKPNDLPSAFAEQVARMSKNTFSAPIQTGNGFHILKLTDVRAYGGRKVSLTDKQIENLLLQKKFEEAIQKWLLKLRAQAFIKFQDDLQKA